MKRATAPLSYSGPPTAWEERHLTRGQSFEIVRAFEDADGDGHNVGDRWVVLGAGFSRFDDTMWLGIRAADGGEWLLPLDWREARQADVLEHWERYARAPSQPLSQG